MGGLSANTVVEDVKQYFEQFGKVRLLFIITLHTCSVVTITIILALFCSIACCIVGCWIISATEIHIVINSEIC